MAQQENDFFPWPLTNTFALNLPASSECNWGCGEYDPVGNSVSYDDCNIFDGSGSICVQQPRRRRAILPRSWLGRPTAPPESVTTYKCSYYRKCYSKRCPIWPRNHLHRSCAPPPRCTMNQLTFGYRLRHNMWY